MHPLIGCLRESRNGTTKQQSNKASFIWDFIEILDFGFWIFAMIRPRLLLIGKIGQVGWELRRTLAPLAQVPSVDFPEIDLTNGDSIRPAVGNTKPAVIINAAAYTAVDKPESEPERAMQIN